MNPTSPAVPGGRPRAREYMRAAVALTLALAAVGFIAARHRSDPSAFAATNAGAVQILVPPGSPAAGQLLTSGSASTPFALVPPTGAACTGDSASDNYKVHSFMAPASVDPNTITYDAGGPFPQALGANLLVPLFSAAGTPVANVLTAVKTTSSPGGLLTGLPVLSFDALVGGDVPAGTYVIGFACVLAPAGVATTLDRWWGTQITFSAGLSWTAGAPAPTTTTTTTTLPVVTTTTSTTTTLPVATSTSTTTTLPVVTSTSTTMPTTVTTAPSAPSTTIDDDHEGVEQHHDHGGRPRECGRRRYGRGATDRVGVTCVPRTTPVTPTPPRRSKEHS